MKDKKIILIFSAFYTPFLGGAEMFVREITKRLKDKYQFIIITSRIQRTLPREEEREGIKVYRVGFGFKIDKYFYPVLAPFKSYFVKHDLVQAVLESYAGLALLVYRIFQKKPALLSLQSQKDSIPKFLFKRIHLVPDKVHAISNVLAQRAKEFGAKNIEVIPNGVDPEKFKNLNTFLKEKHRIISVAHLKKVKGIEYLIRAMPEISETFPDAKLVLVGEGPEREKLRLKSQELKISDRVEFKGTLSSARIPEELMKSEVFVLPSISEGMGIALVEARAAEIPVVATRVGGILDVIEDQKTGILVEPKDSQAIAKAVIKIFSEPVFAQNLIKEARLNLEEYDWQNIAEKINKIYQELL